MQNTSPIRPFVVARDQIPLGSATSGEQLQARPFLAHELMARVHSPGAELSWLEVKAGRDVGPTSHAESTLLIVMRGRASLLGTPARAVEAGDVLTLPGGQTYGFSSVEADLHILRVSFPAADRSESEADALTLERVLARHRRRTAQALQGPGYAQLRDGLLDTSRKRAAACQAIRVFSDAFQVFLFTRQAMCRDAGYATVFHGHLVEELGHNELLEVARTERIFGDPILRATSAWFSHQMLTLDNAGKTIVNLVLETSGYHFHNLAKAVFAAGDSTGYFQVHAEDDADHMQLGMELLTGLHPDVYRRLLEVLDDSWDMMDTVTTRFVELAGLEVEEASCAAQ